MPLPITIQNPVSSRVDTLDLKRVGQNQFEVDDDLRLIPKSGIKSYNLFGIGLGYSIKTSNKHVKAEKNLNSRADGVRLYCSIVPNVLYHNICLKKYNNRGIKASIEARAASMQRSMGAVYSLSHNRQRISSVTKDMNMEITPIEEVCSKQGKGKQTKAGHTKNYEKLMSVYDNSKKGVKPESRKHRKKVGRKAGDKANLVKPMRLNSDDAFLTTESNIFDSPKSKSRKFKETNHLERVKKLSTFDSSTQSNIHLDDVKQGNDLVNIANQLAIKDPLQNLLSADQSEITVLYNNENQKFYQTEETLLQSLSTNPK